MNECTTVFSLLPAFYVKQCSQSRSQGRSPRGPPCCACRATSSWCFVLRHAALHRRHAVRRELVLEEAQQRVGGGGEPVARPGEGVDFVPHCGGAARASTQTSGQRKAWGGGGGHAASRMAGKPGASGSRALGPPSPPTPRALNGHACMNDSTIATPSSPPSLSCPLCALPAPPIKQSIHSTPRSAPNQRQERA